MSKGGSRSSTTTQSRQDVSTTNLNIEDIAGTAIVGEGNTIISTDLGAIEGAGSGALWH